MTDSKRLLKQFEERQISAPDFHHQDHIEVAFQMLEAYDFVEACTRYASTIRSMANSVGVPEKFNTTITFAFMSLIAERKSRFDGESFEHFLEANSDLLDRNVLSSWYTKERLASAKARDHFLLPDRTPGEAA